MIDADDVREALAGATPPPAKARGQWSEPSTPTDEAVAAFGRRVARFLEDLPGDVSISELRDLLPGA